MNLCEHFFFFFVIIYKASKWTVGHSREFNSCWLKKKKKKIPSPGILKRISPEVVKKVKTLREMGELAFFCRFVVLLTFGNITD